MHDVGGSAVKSLVMLRTTIDLVKGEAHWNKISGSNKQEAPHNFRQLVLVNIQISPACGPGTKSPCFRFALHI